MDEDILELGSGVHKVEVDIMEPINPEKAPKVHQPALNHVGLWVDNIEAAVGHLTKEGLNLTPGGIRLGASKHYFSSFFTDASSTIIIDFTGGHKVAFIHPKSAAGVLVELVQAPPEVIAANP